MPESRHRTGPIVAIVLIALLLLAALGVGGYFAWKAWGGKDSTPVTPVEEPAGTGDDTADGYATAEDAVRAELVEAGYDDWVYQLYEEDGSQFTYWAGPPQSEFAEEIVVHPISDGSWVVSEVNPLDFGGDVSGDPTAADEAMNVVSQFLYAVQDDRGEDAHALTVEPFSNDAASAQVSAGMFETFEVSGAIEQSDSSYWVKTIQVWSGAEERWLYLVVPTEAGYYIADLEPW